MNWNRVTTTAFALAIAAMGCSGELGTAESIDPERRGTDGPSGPISDDREPGEVGSIPDDCEPSYSLSTPTLQPLSASQYLSAARQLLDEPGLVLDLEDTDNGTYSALAVDKINRAAELLASHSSFDPWLPTNCADVGAQSCASEFIDSFGLATFRRSVSDAERTELLALFDAAAAQFDTTTSLRIVAQAILQSPQMLYRHVRGEPVGDGVARLTPQEIASRLAFFLWDGPPDPELLQSAEGRFDDRDSIVETARELLLDERSRTPLNDRMVDWMQLDGTDQHAALVDTRAFADMFPQDNPLLRQAMRRELVALFDRTFQDYDGSVEYLLSTTDAYVNGPLADLYGVAHPSSDPAEFGWVQLPADERAGLLTRAGFLSLFANPKVQSPIKRGAFILENLFCVHLGEPPPDVDDSPVEGGGDDGTPKSVRESVAELTGTGSCRACHQYINPVGFAFESYDAMGVYQSSQEVMTPDDVVHDLAIDTATEIKLPNGETVEVSDAIDLSNYLAGDAQVRECFTQRWFGIATGRAPTAGELCAMRTDAVDFYESGELFDLVGGIVASDSFSLIDASGGQ